MNIPVRIHTPFIRLDALLKYAGVVETGGIAKSIIQDGLVKVDGEVCTARGKKITSGQTVDLADMSIRVTAAQS